MQRRPGRSAAPCLTVEKRTDSVGIKPHVLPDLDVWQASRRRSSASARVFVDPVFVYFQERRHLCDCQELV